VFLQIVLNNCLNCVSLLCSEALPYLPSGMATPDESGGLPPTATCSFGPFGRQTRQELSMFDSHAMCKLWIICVSFPAPALV
jgi:hypothetical protein